ncbi:hypothetical protein ciss_04830 [Carboxydothermus islandicus]|uniref:Regulatory protein YycH-like domain-containing protein n=1 Tax=Carboxydothermus islandicus TaxID=661089 RepID=A0A1L8D047_9THEO|nr:hypothetical protein [Carboxydothermus islandicus]GAV24550.1 hypothetical protein ciss_04830 [Carboxydothermus islandicus]
MRRKFFDKKVLLALGFTLTVISLILLILNFLGRPLNSAEIILRQKEVNFPAEVNVYRFQNNKVDKTKALKLAGIFGLENPEIQDEEDRFILKDKNKILTIEKKTGFFSFVSENKPLLNPKHIPPTEKAVSLARNFLTQNNLLPERFKQVKVTEEKAENVIARNVWFYPVVDNLPVYGVSRIGVRIGENGEIMAVDKYYRDFTFYRKQKIKPFRNALEQLRKGQIIGDLPASLKKIYIEKVSLGYYEDERQKFLIPVYVVVGEAQDARGQLSKFEVFLPLI